MQDVPLRFRAGRSWRLNPTYREALRGTPRAGADPSRVGVLDVMKLEVDGIDLLAGSREDDVFRMVGDLARAAERLALGRRKASLSVGAPPVELLLVRAPHAVQLSLVQLGPPPEVRVRDLAIEDGAFFEAARACIEEVLADLRALDPRLVDGPYGTRLKASVRRLRARSRHAEPAAPAGPTRGRRPSRPRTADGPAGLACGFEISDEDDRLASYAESPEGDLHALLVPGRVQLHAAGLGEVAASEEPPYLAFRTLVGECRDVLAAWEAGEPQATLRLGEAALTLDLPAGRVAVPGARPLQLAIPALCSVLLRAALDFCAAVVSRAPAQRANPWLAELGSDAAGQLAHCRQLLDGDLTAEPPAGRPAPPPAGERAASARPLGPWRVRRLAFRERWSFEAGPLLPEGLGRFGRRLLLVGEDGAFALERNTGQRAWQREAVSGLWWGPGRADPIVLAGPMGLDLVTPGGDTAWSRPWDPPRERPGAVYLRGAGALVLSVDGRSVVAFGEADGSPRWRFVPPGGRRVHLAGGPDDVLVAADTGFVYALDIGTGRVRWRVRTGVTPTGAPHRIADQVIVPGQGPHGPALALTHAPTGRDARTVALPLDEAGAPFRFGRRLVVPGQAGTSAALALIRPGEGDPVRRVVLPGLSGLPRALPTRGRWIASDAGGRLCACDAQGRPLWAGALPAPRLPGHPPPALALARGVLVAAWEAAHALDPDTGEELGRHPFPSVRGALHLRVDDRLDVHAADEDGTLHALTLATHLSVVG